MKIAVALLTLVLTLAACDDALDQRLAILDAPRVLAVTAEPAEGRPGAVVRYAALVAGPDGVIDAAPRWAFCTAPKPPTEDNAVSTDCVAGRGLVELGTSATAMGPLPADGCLNFGPDVAAGGFRPRDADPTGGFYQPVRLDTDGLAPLSFALTRITCKLGQTSAAVARRYELEYVANRNPVLEPATGLLAAGRAPANSDVELVAQWPADSAENYLAFDADRQDLVVRREAMRVSWFATDGVLPVDATAVGEDEDATRIATTWHTPAAGLVTIVLVLRDSRGGVATQTFALVVE